MDPLAALDHARLKRLQLVGVACGFTAGAWLGAAEAPTKMVTLGIPPVVISLAMVAGVFLARWSLPALVRGTRAIGDDVRAAPHLVVWAVLAGCLWAVANTLTIFAIKDIGLAIAFPLWNSNSLLGIVWGFVFFNELRQAGWARWAGVLGGALVMFAGAGLLAAAAAGAGKAGGHAARGIAAALTAGVLWGTMYIPYRKAYLTGMNPLSFVTFFTVGEMGMMTLVAAADRGGVVPLLGQLVQARAVLFWLFAGGFVWVVGDLFQQYAAKYIGISRGIPLSNTNQLWGLLWGTLVFGELKGAGATLSHTIAGSVLMALGAAAIALATAGSEEHVRWQVAAHREGARYGVDPAFVRAGLAGRATERARSKRNPLDWAIVIAATAVFVGFGLVARVPALSLGWGAMASLVAVSLGLLLVTGYALWRVTKFN